ncbi:MAG: NAD-dependent dehydratase [Gallionellales bacterium 35-53-114]|nr:MAG: NAD-dependent dehydratase [Gallionellales bacterium 35-53-114]OYZ63431.1 MAG: NAD-dependent dehydratase [Gallionellales bacterium 24-53-125]OZB10956.1 MAG: NAD-dependent dehydratase [Gallionellales bacterium 39-52-133]
MIRRVALVTGGSGFTGSSLIRRLTENGWLVHAIVRTGSNLNLLDEKSEQLKIHIHDGSTSGMIAILALSKPDVVFHLASLVLTQHKPDDLLRLLQSNIIFATQLAEAMSENNSCSLINTGTFWQHYENRDYAPTTLYAATKQAFEDILKYYVDAKNFRVITLTLFDSYGPGDPRPKLFRLLRDANISRQTLLMSPGEQLIDLVHIKDVVEAYIVAANLLFDSKVIGHERYSVSSGKPVKLKELVRIYEKVANTTIPIEWGGRNYRDREVMVPWSRGNSLPDWRPRISLLDGIKSVLTD